MSSENGLLQLPPWMVSPQWCLLPVWLLTSRCNDASYIVEVVVVSVVKKANDEQWGAGAVP